MRIGMNALAIAFIAVGVIAGLAGLAFAPPVLALAFGAGVTFLIDFGYRLASGRFADRGGVIRVGAALHGATQVPLWIVGFGLGGGLLVASLPRLLAKHATGETSASSTSAADPPAGTFEPAPPIDDQHAAAFLAFMDSWVGVVSSDKLDCDAKLVQLRAIASKDGQAVRAVYDSGRSLPPAIQSRFAHDLEELDARAHSCPSIRIQDELERVREGGP